MSIFNFIFIFIFFIYSKEVKDFKKLYDSAATPIYAENENDSISVLYSSSFDYYSKEALLQSQKLISLSGDIRTCTLSSGERIIANKEAFVIINDGTFQKSIYSSINNIIYPSLTCLNDKFAVIAISSDTPNISLYNKTGDREKSFGMNSAKLNNSDCVSSSFNGNFYFVCMYINKGNQNETHYYILNSNLDNITGNINIYHGFLYQYNETEEMVEPYSSKENMGFKLRKINETHFLLVMLKNGTTELYTVVVKINNIDTEKPLIKVAPTNNNGHFAPITGCEYDINHVSIAIVSNNKFAVTCKQSSNYYYAFVEINDRSLANKKNGTLSNSNEFSNLNIVGIQGSLGIFFNQENLAYFTLLFYPICYDIIIINIYVNNNGTNIDFSNNIKDGYIETKSYQIKISTNEINEINNNIKFYYKDNSNNIYEVSSDELYSTSNNQFTFYSGTLSGNYTFSYSVIIDSTVVSCFIKLIISCSNFPNCNECEYLSDKNSESCKTCDTENLYYPLTKDGITECYKNESRPDGYYLDGNIYKKCDEGCTKCYGGTNNNCLNDNSCSNNVCCNINNNYYPIEDQLDSCYKNESRPDGYYLDSNIYKKCIEACSSCNEVGETENTTCINCDNKKGYYEYPINSNSARVEVKHCVLYNTLINHYYFYSNGFHKCDDSCLTCDASSDLEKKCLICDNDNNYYNFYNEQSPFKCYNSDNLPSRSFISNENKIIYQCNKACKSCEEIGNDEHTKCIECADGYFEENENENPKNCVNNCKNYIYTFYDGNIRCTSNLNCPNEFPFLIPDKKECVESCDKYYYDNICYNECPDGTLNIDNDSYECFDISTCKLTSSNIAFSIDEVKSLTDSLMNSYLNKYSYTNKHVNYYENNDFCLILYKDYSCAKELTNNLVFADLNDCIQNLRQTYSISNDIPLAILLINIIKSGTSNKISYLIYNSETGENINLSPCNKIDITIPLEHYENINIESAQKFAEMGIDVFNLEDSFFNDLCFTYTSDDGKDVTLSDRVDNYYQNISLCDKDCTYEGVNYETNEVSCSCEVETDFMDDLLDNKLTGEIYEIVKSLNIKVLKCYSLFTGKNLISNIGGWIMNGFIIGQIIMTIIYSKNGLDSVREYLLDFIKANPPRRKGVNLKLENNNSTKEILNEDDKKIIIDNNEISTNKQNNNNMKFNQNLTNLSENLKKEEKQEINIINIPQSSKTIESRNSNKNMITITSKHINEDKMTELNNITEGPNLYIQSLENEEEDIQRNNILNINKRLIEKEEEPSSTIQLKETEFFIPIHKEKNYFKNEKTGLIEIFPEIGYIKDPVLYDISEKPYSEEELNKLRKITEDKNITEEKNENYDDDELNEMELYNAIDNDKRTFWKFYVFQLKEQQEIFDSFFKYEPFEPFIIKKMTFFFSLSLYFTLNAIFYSEDIISKKFNNKGKINFFEFLKMELNIIVYSTAVGMVVLYIIKFIFSARRRLDTLVKREKDSEIFRNEAIKCMNRMKKEFIFFIILTFLFELFFWYYLICFCNVYKNTQIDWLKSSLITIFVIEILPFFLVLLIAILRFVGMKFKLESLYKTSQCLAEA